MKTDSIGKRPQLTLDEMRQLKWLLGGMLILLSVWTVFYLEIDAWVLMGLATAGVGSGLIWPQWPARVPRFAHTLAFPFIVAFFLGDLWVKGEMLPAMVRLDILLLLYRGISYRQQRDDLQVIVLGLFLIVVAGVLTVSLTFAAQILAFTGCALAFLLVITLTESVEPKPANAKKGLRGLITWNAPAMGLPTWAAHIDWRRLARRLRAVADWRVLTLGAVLFAGVVGVSALLFLAIPRFQMENSLFLERFISKKSRTGFNDSIKFGDVSEIQQDTSVALSVDISDPKQVPAMPYWRMLVLDEYREGGFRLSPTMTQTLFGRERTAASLNATAPTRGNATVWTFYLESGVSRYMPLLGRFNLLQFREAQTFRPSNELGVVALRSEPATMTAYRVEGMNFADALPDPTFAERWKRRPAATPTGGRGETLLQRRLTINAADHAALARVRSEIGGEMPVGEFGRKATEWLLRNHGYSLEPKIPSGAGEAIVRWTTSKEAGHCELFAGAMALLARDAGFAARVVVGFKGGSWNGYSNNYSVRNSNAHAWTELWDEAQGAWLRVDPLAPVSTDITVVKGDGAIAQRLDRSWTARFDSLRIFWYRRIVSFDAQSQVETLQAVKTATESTGKRLRAALEEAVAGLKAWLAGPWDVRRVVKLFVAIAALVGFGWVLKNFRSLLAGLARGERRVDPVRREAGRWLVELRGSDTSEGAEVKAQLERLRFGPQASWTKPEMVFRRAKLAARAQRKAHVSRP